MASEQFTVPASNRLVPAGVFFSLGADVLHELLVHRLLALTESRRVELRVLRRAKRRASLFAVLGLIAGIGQVQEL